VYQIIPGQFERIADFILNSKFAEVPEQARLWAKRVTLDTLGVAAAASVLPAGQIAREFAANFLCAAPAATAAHLLFDGRPASSVGAAFALAAQIDNLDAHDGFNPVKGHIGVVVIPAMLATAETLGRKLSGKEALMAVLMGYEIAGRAGLALHATVTDYHTSGAWNALGVTALAARLLKLTPGQLRAALGYAEFHGPRSQMMREIDYPSMLHDGSAWGALSGLSAVQMTRLGFAAGPAITLEGQGTESFWDDCGSWWVIEHQYIKPYPICRWAHALIDGVLALREQHQLQAEDVQCIEIATFHESTRLFQGQPESSAVAQYSLPFAVSVALLRGTVGVDEIRDDVLHDPQIRRLIGQTTIREDALCNERFPEGRYGEVTLVLNSGKRLSSGIVNARGGPDDPFSAQELSDKFHHFADPVLGLERAAAIEETVMSMDNDDSDISTLVDLVIPPGRAVVPGT